MDSVRRAKDRLFWSMWTALSACSTTSMTSRKADRRLSGTGQDGNPRKKKKRRSKPHQRRPRLIQWEQSRGSRRNWRQTPATSVGDISIGTRLTIDGRQFEVDSVDDHTQNVSLRDVTFEGGTGFPIFRKESIDYVRAHMEQPDMVWKLRYRRRTSRLRYSPRRKRKKQKRACLSAGRGWPELPHHR